jgi:hypothetical protein
MGELEKNTAFKTEQIDFINISNYFKTYKIQLEVETKRLSTDLYSSLDEATFKTLRLYIVDSASTSQKAVITLQMLKALYIIYTNANDRYKFTNDLLFNNQHQRVFIGISKELYLELNPKDTRSQNDNNLPTLVFPFDFSSINTIRTKKSNPFNHQFNRFVQTFKANQKVLDPELKIKYPNLLFLNKKITDIIKDFYDNLNRILASNSIQEQEGEEIENIYSLGEYMKKYPNLDSISRLNDITIHDLQEAEENNDDSKYYVPNESVKLSNIHTLLNKYGEFDFDFLLSPLVKRFKFSLTTPQEIITRTKIRVMQKEFVTQNEYESIDSKLKYVCPTCEQQVSISPNEIGTEIIHYCGLETHKKTKINMSIVSPEVKTPVVLYKCSVCTNYEDVLDGRKEEWLTEMYLYSFKDDILPGNYVADIVKFYDTFSVLTGKKSRTLYLILGTMLEKQEYTENKIIKNQIEIDGMIAGSVANKHRTQFMELNKLYNPPILSNCLPKHKLFNILFSIRQYYKNRFGIEIDNSGLFLQVIALLSVISRLAFKEKKMSISVMGVGSVSKTFPCNMVFAMTDLNYKYISDSTRLTVAGMTGGVNTSAVINGQTTRKFEQGAISNDGVVVFDECQTIFLRPDIQAILKSIPQEEYEVSVIGGAKIRYDCTPVFLSNFNEFMKKYEQQIVDAYILKYKSEYRYDEERKFKQNPDIIKYLSQINLYHTIEYYAEVCRDDLLAKVISAVRKKYENDRIDWKTGSQIEAMNRILFDVVVHRKVAQNFKEELRYINVREINLNAQMPVKQTIDEILKYIYNVTDTSKIKMINLNNEEHNSNKTIEQLTMLDQDIFRFLASDPIGMCISDYYMTDVDNFDKKIRNLVIKTIKMLQLIDDITATELSSEVKELSRVLLLKCKRGLPVEEYNMQVNLRNIRTYNFDSGYLLDLDDTRSDLYYDERRLKDVEKIKKEIEDKMSDKTSISDLVGIDLSKEDTNKTYTFDEMCKKLNCPYVKDEARKAFIAERKKWGAIYEPKNGVYKFDHEHRSK